MTVYSHCTENHIFFFRASWKDSLSKKIALEFDLSCIIGKYDISFSRKFGLTSRRKMKDDLSQKKKKKKKIHGNMKFSSNVLKRWTFQEGPCRDLIFLVLSGKVVFFPQNMVFFPWMENEGGMTFLKRYTEIWYFLLDIFHVVLQT